MVLARFQRTIVDALGNVLPGATITVRKEIAGAPLAVLYTDRAGTVPLGNPFAADGDGFAAFHTAGGAFRITAASGSTSIDWRYVPIGLAGEADGIVNGTQMLFASATADADPGAGYFRFNNATPASVTTIYIDNAAVNAADLSTWLDSFDDGGSSGNRGTIVITQVGGDAFFMGQVTGSVVDGTGYRKITVTPLATVGTFVADRGSGVVFNGKGVDGTGDVNGPGSSVDGNLASFNGTGGKTIQDSGKSITTVGAGKQTIWVPASGIYTTGSPSTGVLNVGGAIIPYLAFDPTASEFAFFNIGMPKSWDEGTLTAKVYWTHPATVTNFGVSWFVGAAAFSNDDAFANAYAGQDVTDTGGTTSDLYITSETAAIDPGNTQVEGDLLLILVSRDPTAGADTLAVDAFLVGVMIHYTTNANTDA